MEHKSTSKDFFLYLAVLVTLYVSAVSLVNVIFETINRAFPDQLSYYVDPYSSALRWAIASLIIMFPLFGLLSRLLRNDMAKEPAKKGISVRRWFIFLTLFLTGATIAIDLIALINTFLGGEITIRFILKVISLLIVAGGIFAYYFTELRKEVSKNTAKLWFIGATLFVIASIVVGFVVMGSPSTARKHRFDDQRVSDLQSIQWQIVNFWQQKGRLPSTLDELKDPISGFLMPVDPKTSESYEYLVRDAATRAFSLCATFELPLESSLSSTYPQRPPESYDKATETWVHKAGRVCFERTIDPELYPVRKDAKI